MKKLFAIMLMSVLMLPSVVHADYFAIYADEHGLDELSQFSDIDAGHVNYYAINLAANGGVVQGYEDGTFGPDKPVNRAELIKIIVEYVSPEPDPELYHNCFNDINQEWYAPYVCFAKEELGIVQGYDDDTYRPANEVNRVEAIKIISQALLADEYRPTLTTDELAIPMPVDLDISQWYADDMRFVILKELVDGYHVTQNADGTLNFHPGDAMTRKEVVEMLYRIDFYYSQRETYAKAMAEGACFLVANENVLTESELDTGFYEIFAEYGWNAEEADLVTTKYYYDDYADSQIDEWAGILCE